MSYGLRGKRVVGLSVESFITFFLCPCKAKIDSSFLCGLAHQCSCRHRTRSQTLNSCFDPLTYSYKFNCLILPPTTCPPLSALQAPGVSVQTGSTFSGCMHKTYRFCSVLLHFTLRAFTGHQNRKQSLLYLKIWLANTFVLSEQRLPSSSYDECIRINPLRHGVYNCTIVVIPT